MKDGVKIEEGSHPELIAKNGEYKKLFELSQRD
jgi:ABC-type multidrug transport system fused ATPase/permease subunit